MKIALTLPGTGNIIDNPVKDKFTDLGSIISGFLNIAFYVAIFAAFYFLVWGAFSYMMAQGKKEDIAKARDRITWAIVGLLVVLLAYFLTRFAVEILKNNTKGGVPF